MSCQHVVAMKTNVEHKHVEKHHMEQKSFLNVRHFGSIMLSLASTTTLSVLFFVLFVPGSTPAEQKDEQK